MADDRILGKLEEFKRATERRLDKIEHKIDKLHEYKWRLAGGLTALSVVMTVVLKMFV